MGGMGGAHSRGMAPQLSDGTQGGHTQPPRGRMFYNDGWSGEPIKVANAEARYKPQGQHIMLDVYDSDPDFLNNMEELTRVSRELLLNAGMHILYAPPPPAPFPTLPPIPSCLHAPNPFDFG
jgi:hypothetical protein